MSKTDGLSPDDAQRLHDIRKVINQHMGLGENPTEDEINATYAPLSFEVLKRYRDTDDPTTLEDMLRDILAVVAELESQVNTRQAWDDALTVQAARDAAEPKQRFPKIPNLNYRPS